MSMIIDDNGSGKTPGEETTAPVAESTAAGGEGALARLREELEAIDANGLVETALNDIEEALRHPRAQSTDGGDDSPPSSAQRRTVRSNDDNGGDDDAPPTSRILSPPLSRFALRDDGALLLSLEDAADRDTTGREVIAFLVLSTEEAARVRATVDGAFSDAAAQTIGRLPKRAP